MTHARVQSYEDDVVTLNSGARITTTTLVWTAGTSPNPLLAGLPVLDPRGRLAVDDCLRVPGVDGLWALGDAASVPDGGTRRPARPPRSMRCGRASKWRESQSHTHGQSAAAVSLPLAGRAGRDRAAHRRGARVRHQLLGFVAWWMWRTVYLAKLPRFEKKLRVMLDWTLDLVFTKDLVQFMAFRSHGISDAAAHAAAHDAHDVVARPAPDDAILLHAAGGTRQRSYSRPAPDRTPRPETITP